MLKQLRGAYTSLVQAVTGYATTVREIDRRMRDLHGLEPPDGDPKILPMPEQAAETPNGRGRSAKGKAS
jgi:hypothetical protein